MRRLAIALGLLAVASSEARAQQRGTAAPKMTQEEATQATLTRLEELWASAIMRRDRAAFERNLAPKFIYTINDQLVRRPDYIAGLLGNVEMITDARTDSLEVHQFGNTGVVTGWRIISGRTRDAGFERRYRFTDTWMPRSGTWQMIAAHDYIDPLKR